MRQKDRVREELRLSIKECYVKQISVFMMKRFTLTAASLLFGLTAAMAQDTKVTGHVVDENGDPVIGATVLVKGTTLGTVTDFDGNFTLDVPSEHKQLEISYVGMETVQVGVSSNVMVKCNG